MLYNTISYNIKYCNDGYTVFAICVRDNNFAKGKMKVILFFVIDKLSEYLTHDDACDIMTI